MTSVRVSAIERRGRRLTIQFEDAAPLACDREFLPAARLQAGDALEGALLPRLREQAQQHDAETAAVRWLAVRPRSRAEIGRRLRGRGLPAAVVEAALARLASQGYLDDRGFAEAWTEQRLRAQPRAQRMIRAELQAQGVDRAVAAAATEGVDDAALALRIASEGVRRCRGDWATYQRRVGGALMRRGFGGATAAAALRTAWRDRPGEAAPSVGDDVPE